MYAAVLVCQRLCVPMFGCVIDWVSRFFMCGCLGVWLIWCVSVWVCRCCVVLFGCVSIYVCGFFEFVCADVWVCLRLDVPLFGYLDV